MVNEPTEENLEPRVNDKQTTNVPSATGAAIGGYMENMTEDELELEQREQDIRRELIAVFFKHDMSLGEATDILSALNAVVTDTTAKLKGDGGFTFIEAFENEEGMEAVLLAKLVQIDEQHIDELSRQIAAYELNELGL